MTGKLDLIADKIAVLTSMFVNLFLRAIAAHGSTSLFPSSIFSRLLTIKKTY